MHNSRELHNRFSIRPCGSSQVKSSSVGLRDRVAIIRTLIFSYPHPFTRALLAKSEWGRPLGGTGTKNTKLAIVSFKFVLIQILDNCVICALQTSVSNFNQHKLFLGLIEKFFKVSINVAYLMRIFEFTKLL